MWETTQVVSHIFYFIGNFDGISMKQNAPLRMRSFQAFL